MNCSIEECPRVLHAHSACSAFFRLAQQRKNSVIILYTNTHMHAPLAKLMHTHLRGLRRCNLLIGSHSLSTTERIPHSASPSREQPCLNKPSLHTHDSHTQTNQKPYFNPMANHRSVCPLPTANQSPCNGQAGPIRTQMPQAGYGKRPSSRAVADTILYAHPSSWRSCMDECKRQHCGEKGKEEAWRGDHK